MKNGDKYIWPVFWVILGLFILTVASTLVPVGWPLRRGFPVWLALLLVSGLVLVILAIMSGKEKKLKAFLILSGAAVAALPVFIILHGAVYSLLIMIFGPGFWGSAGKGDEPVFFILAVIICPLAYLVGATGSIYLQTRTGRKTKKA